MTERKIENFEEALNLVKEILCDDGQPQDSAGNTRLTLLADKIKLLLHDNVIERYYYIEAINSCAKILDNFSITEIRNLCKLINLAEMLPYEFHKAFLDSFNGWKATLNNVGKRAEVFRLIGESGSDMEVDFIEKGVDEIKEAYPWYWIDVAMYLDKPAAISAIKELLKVKRDFTPILQRLPHWWDLYKDKEEYYKLLSSLLKGANSEDVTTVRLFLESFGLQENKIDGIIELDEQINADFIEETIIARSCYQLMYA